MAKTRLMMLGPPGAGKGTQAQRLSDHLNVPQISTGDMLRNARRSGSELGLKAAAFMDAGDLVPDDVVIGLVAERLKESDAENGFILDGFPRTVEQAEALEAMGVKLEAVVNIVVSEDEVIRRLGGRLSCPNCGASFHSEFQPPKVEGICDECGSPLMRREDDRPEAIRGRLVAYNAKTQPLVEYYRQVGVLREIDGVGSPDHVYERLLKAID
ncbi:adenylate kinase [Bradymonas sediminis]|uniref:Adenylate kinase n=1 Tax=Bradymonas sediminis TaxID=1548548 RepID=A0A2Z4FGD6_9DELT|nr:adenylate kinase [Bradymonas sediminis]AWV88003.1 adenylate kinase [Bradymonas sediminis]TDP77126.1 adenylate kinase [Bradymonas sediminis]